MKNTWRFVLMAFFFPLFPMIFVWPAHGQIFVVNQYDQTIRQFTPSGVGSIFLPASAGLNIINGGITFNDSGDMYAAVNSSHAVYRISPDGTPSVFGNLDAVSASGAAFDNTGTNLYVVSYGNGHIFKFTPDGTRTTFASGLNNAPTGLAFDSAGNLYVACQDNTIRKFDPNGNGSIFADSSAGLNGPTGLAYRAGFLYTANLNDHTIRKIDSSGTGTIFAGVPGETTHGLNDPYGLAFDSDGNLYVSNQGDNTLWKFDTNGTGSVFVPAGTLIEPAFMAFKPGCSPALLTIANYAGISVSGSIGCTYEVDYATNLNNPIWTPIVTNTLSTNPFLFIDTNVIAGTRFYRAVTQ